MRLILAIILLLGASGVAVAQFAPWQPMIWKSASVTPPGTSCAASLTSSASGADTLTASATVANALTCQ